MRSFCLRGGVNYVVVLFRWCEIVLFDFDNKKCEFF